MTGFVQTDQSNLSSTIKYLLDFAASGGGGGGGGGSGYMDLLYIDATATQFFWQDTGTALRAYLVQAGNYVSYTPVAPWYPYSVQSVTVNAPTPLPTGASTSALQTTGNTALGAIQTNTAAAASALAGTLSVAVTGSVALPTGAATAANQASELTALAQLHADLIAALPAGTNIIGKIGIDQTTPGTTNGVQLTAGTAIAGKFGIDQTTQGATNGVYVNGFAGALSANQSYAQTLQQPSSNLLGALNAASVWQVEPGVAHYLTITNPAGATAQFVGTVTFQTSPDGSTWTAANATPVGTPTAQSANNTTVTGLWQIISTNGATAYIRAIMTAYTSGSVYAALTPFSSPSSLVLSPWSYTVTSGQTLVGPLDASNFSELGIQISAVTTTVLTVQGTNDPTLTTWDTIPVQEAKSQNAGATTITAAGTYRALLGPYKWVRVQVTTTGTVLTVQGVVLRSGSPIALSSFGNSIEAVIASGTVTTVTTVTTLTSMTSGNLGIPGTIADVASAALTTTTTTATLTPTFGASYEVNMPVTAVSGTTPTLDVVIQESDDAGTNWFDVYHFPRITATGMYRSPKLPLTGNRVRYVQTVAGTTPSFTRAINRLQSSDSVTPFRRIFDRSLASTQALNAVTASLVMQGVERNVQLVIAAGTITTTAPILKLQGSDDLGTTWYDLPSGSLTAVTSATVQVTVANVNAELVRAIVTTAGVAATLTYVALKAF